MRLAPTRFSVIRSAILGLVLLPALLLCGCDSPPPLTRLEPHDTILAFGDSLTRGTGAQRESSYPSTLESMLGIKVVNAGVPGEVSAEGLERLPGVLAEHRPALVILCHGGNDMLRRKGLEQLAGNLRAMIEACRDAGAEVVLVGVPQPGLILEPPQLYPDLARQYELPYDGETLADLLGERDLKSDSIHPNAAGYRKLARALAELIAEAQAT